MISPLRPLHSGLRPLLICLLSFWLIVLSPLLLAQSENKLALVGGTLIDGNGSQPIPDSIILISGNRIEQVGVMGRLTIPAGYQLLSTEGMTVMPGLWDLHVHLVFSGHPNPEYWIQTHKDQLENITMPASARQLLMAGVTSVRDLAAPTAAIMSVKARIDSGEISGPRIFAAGNALTPIPDSDSSLLLSVGNIETARIRTEQLITAGVSFIKVVGIGPDSLDVLSAIVATAHAGGVRVTAHATTDSEVRLGLAAGVDEFQHIGTDSGQYPDDIMEGIRNRINGGSPVYWSPTLGITLNADELAADPEYLDDPDNFAGLPQALELEIRQAVETADFNVPGPEAVATVRRKVQQLNEAGVIFVSGSDMGAFGHPARDATWRELEAWVFEIGLDPLIAIKWVTADAAAYMGVDDSIGTITPGKLADIIAFKGSPLRNFSIIRNPAIVIKDGNRYK